MAYIGNEPAESYASFLTETFTVSATTNYTLSYAVANENEIRLVINGVVQQPGSGKAYTASGTTLTLSSATVSGDSMYAVYLGRALQTVNPPAASVGNSQTAPTIITGQTAETSIATDDTILIHDTSASALRKMTRANFVSGIGGTNTPSFMVKQTGTQNISHETWTKVQFNSEVFDTDGTFDSSSNFRWTPGVAGKYFMYLGLTIDDLADSKRIYTKVYKNGSGVAESLTISSSGTTAKYSNNTSFIDIADADDYYEAYIYHDIGSQQELRTDYQTIFMGYKIIE